VSIRNLLPKIRTRLRQGGVRNRKDERKKTPHSHQSPPEHSPSSVSKLFSDYGMGTSALTFLLDATEARPWAADCARSSPAIRRPQTISGCLGVAETLNVCPGPLIQARSKMNSLFALLLVLFTIVYYMVTMASLQLVPAF
jgi:hypothetical protein